MTPTPKDGENWKQTMTEPSRFSHPVTGELLDSREDFLAAIMAAETKLNEHYRYIIWPLRDGYAERFPAAEPPAPRYRTQVQEKVARCPRCGGRLEKDGE